MNSIISYQEAVFGPSKLNELNEHTDKRAMKEFHEGFSGSTTSKETVQMGAERKIHTA